ncbi:MAG: hypothetical protein BM560_00515 [Roseobacter sp. MedPE-SWde]|nr:MAG: hypothetical protein BM560_00515 [Roseobacter sp. MedPE-SWde]
MGAWGVGIFEDDQSLDWLAGEYSSAGAKAVRATLFETVRTGPEDYLEAPKGIEARAAAEVVAAANGAGDAALEERHLAILLEHADSVRSDKELKKLSIKAVQRLSGENSEIEELWDGDEEWKSAIAGLLERLKRMQ